MGLRGGQEEACIGGTSGTKAHGKYPPAPYFARLTHPRASPGGVRQAPEPFHAYPGIANPHCSAENVLSEHTIRRIPQHLGGKAAMPRGSQGPG